jgi:hypothetical protein
VLGHGDLFTSLVYVFPLFLLYSVGVLFTPAMNGVDFVTRHLYAVLGHSDRNYLLAHGVLAVGFGVTLLWLRKRRVVEGGHFVAMLVESAVVALALGSMIVFVMRSLFGLHMAVPGVDAPALAVAPGKLASVVLSIGAGVHEELVFRLGLFAGGAALLRLAGLGHGAATWTAALAGAALFSAVHHLGALGDPWALNTFVYRWLAGLVFTAIFYYRSLAHAVYTHALYDLYVFLILR